MQLTATLLKSLDREYRALLDSPKEARESIHKRFEERSSYVRRREVHVEEDGGYDGITEGLDERGFLNRWLGGLAKAVRSPWQMYPLGLLFGLGVLMAFIGWLGTRA